MLKSVNQPKPITSNVLVKSSIHDITQWLIQNGWVRKLHAPDDA